VLVTKVYGDTPADKAGMKSGDVIVSIGGANLRDPAAMPRTIAMLPLNKAVEIKIFRESKPMTLNVTILEQPEEFGQDRYGGGPLTKGQALDIGGGITIMELTDDLAKQFGYDKGTKGFVINAVAKDSAGAKAGLTRGMIVQKIDETVITTADKALKAMNSASKEKGALFQIAKPNGEIDFIIVSVK
jgi:serine protease Do